MYSRNVFIKKNKGIFFLEKIGIKEIYIFISYINMHRFIIEFISLIISLCSIHRFIQG